MKFKLVFHMEIDVVKLISFKSNAIYSLQTKLLFQALLHDTFVKEIMLFHPFIFETFMVSTII